MKMERRLFFIVTVILGLAGCTQETQNTLSRSLQNWTGTNGVLDIYAGDKLVHRFIKIDKISTAFGTNDDQMSVITSYSIHYTKLYDNIG